MDHSQADQFFRTYLRTGEPRELARVFDLVAPQLLLVAGHLLRDPAAAEDAVQSTFLSAIEQAAEFDVSRPVMPWLTGILVNTARAELRRRKRRPDPGRIPRSPEPDVEDEVEARDLVRVVLDAMDRMPPLYREVLRLRLLHGLSVEETAAALQSPPNTVKTRHRRALEMLRKALPGGLAVALAGGVRAGRGLAAIRSSVLDGADRAPPGNVSDDRPTAATTGARAPASITALVIVCLAASIGGLWSWWPGAGAAGEPGRTPIATGDAAPHTPPSDAAPPETLPQASPRPAPDRAVRHEIVGDGANLVVRARWQRDGRSAAGVLVSARPSRDPSWLREHWQTTDETGTARFEVPPGAFEILAARGGRSDGDVPTEGACVVDLSIPAGTTVRGRVTLDDDSPAAGARIWLGDVGRGPDRGTIVGTTGAGGRFALHDVAADRVVSAFYPDHVAAPAVRIGNDSELNIELRLREGASTIRGRVRDAHGVPCAGAAVLVGRTTTDHANPLPPPMRLRTDENGAFVADSLPFGVSVPVWIRAPGHALWTALAVSLRGNTIDLDIPLVRGASATGRVWQSGTEPAARARVEALQHEVERLGNVFAGPGWARVRTDARDDGSWQLSGIAPGRTVLVATADGIGEAQHRQVLADGEHTEWHARLRDDTFIRGTVRDSAGRPLAGWRVEAKWVRGPGRTAVTAADGSFSFEDCTRLPHRLSARDPASALRHPAVMRGGVQPGAPPIDLVVPEDELARHTIRGVVLGPGGDPLAQTVRLLRRQGNTESLAAQGRADDDGSFAIGRLPPGDYQVLTTGTGHGVRMLARVHLDRDIDIGRHLLELPATLKVRMLDPDGQPARDDLVTFQVPGEFWTLAVPLRGGVGEVVAQPGRYLLFATGHRTAITYREVEVTAAATTEVELRQTAGTPVLLRYPPLAHRATFTFVWRTAGGKLVGRQTLNWPTEPGSLPWNGVEQTVAFAPGAYTVSIETRDGSRTETSFAVPAAAATPPAVDIPLPGARSGR